MKTIALIGLLLLSGGLMAQNTLPASGNVGIGVALPQSLLHISGNGADLNTNAQYGTGNLIIEGKTGGRTLNAGSALEFVLPANTDGNNPWGQARIITVAGNQSTYNASGKMILGTRRNFDKIGLGNNLYYGNDLVINENGNVGFGTLYPQCTIDIYSSSFAGSQPPTNISDLSSIRINGTIANSSHNGVTYQSGGGGGAAIGFYRGGSYETGIDFYTNDVSLSGHIINRMRISSSGNVGIGTTTPGEKLAVNGNIRAKEIKVETANWPDYVFKPDYKITSLSDLEAYIKTNNHLPEMPTAKEAETNGVELGDMNKKLLQKVEELTLYLIEKNAEIIELKKLFLNERKSNASKINSLSDKIKNLEKITQ